MARQEALILAYEKDSNRGIRGKMEHFRVFRVFSGSLAFLFWRRVLILNIMRRLVGAAALRRGLAIRVVAKSSEPRG